MRPMLSAASAVCEERRALHPSTDRKSLDEISCWSLQIQWRVRWPPLAEGPDGPHGTVGHARDTGWTAGASRSPPDSEDDMQTEEPLRGGKLLAAISTTIVAILREHYGRGPMKAKTYALDDIIVVRDARQRLHPAREDDHGQRRSRARRRDAPRLPARHGQALQRRDRGAHRSQGRRLSLPGPRRSRHHHRDLLRRPAAGRLRRGGDRRTGPDPRPAADEPYGGSG